MMKEEVIGEMELSIFVSASVFTLVYGLSEYKNSERHQNVCSYIRIRK